MHITSGVLLMLCVPSVNSFVQSKCVRSVLEFMQNFISRRHQKVSD